MIFLRNSSPVIGDENIPNVPPVAPAWPSADVVAQQSVRKIAALRSYWYSMSTSAVLLVSSSQPPLAFAGLNTRADLDDDRPIFSRDQSHAERRPLAWRRIGELR